MNTEQFPKKEEGKLSIYMLVSENSGVGYYRQFLPAIKLREHGLANVLISDFRWGEGNHVEMEPADLFDVFNWADLVVVGRKDVPQFYAQWGGIRDFFNIPIVLETDDNVHFVEPSNPGYEGYYPGSEAQVWDKYAIGKVFDAVTVTTQELKDFYGKYNPHIYILPNSLDIPEWEKHPIERSTDGSIRMAFLGSGAHSEGINMIKQPVLKIMEKYPRVHFTTMQIFQHLFQDVSESIRNRISFLQWIKLEDWPKGVRALGVDIGLAPLADNMFNRCKSNLRWMECGMAKMAPVVSPVKPYLCVKNGVDGILAREKNDWFAAIERLITDPVFRGRVQNAAYERVKKEFSIDKNVVLWENVYRAVCDKYHEFFGKKKSFIKLGKQKYQERLH